MSRAPLPLAFLVVAFGTTPVRALDPQRATSQYVVTKWGAGALPSATIHSLLQTRDGYVWLGTTTGLVRFDGASFVVFNARRTPDFGDGGVSRLAEGADGRLYVGKSAGTVIEYSSGRFARTAAPAGTGPVSSLLAARDGSIWIGVFGRRMMRLVGGEATPVPQAILQAPLAIAEDAAGAVWIGTREQGLVRWAGGELTRFDATGDSIQALAFDRAGALWVGTPHGLLRLAGGRVERFTRADGLSSDNVQVVLEDRDGNLWVGTAAGLDRRSGNRWSRLTSVEGLSDDDIRSLLEDREGNLWVGTADGLNCVSEAPFTTYGRLEGLEAPAVPSVIAARGGGVWIGTASGGLARLRDGVFEHYRLPAGVGREAVLALHEARDGALWIALDNARLFRLADGRITEQTPLAPEKDWKVRAMFEDERGMVFMVAALGLARLEDRRLVPLDADAPRMRYPHMAHRDRHGVLWVGDLLGLARLEAGRWRFFTVEDGLPHNRVRWVAEDEAGGLWAATAGGLAYVDGGVIRKVTVAEGLPESYLRVVLDDGLGHLWVASMGHVFRLDKAELRELFAGTRALVSPLVFDTSDGLRTTEGLLSSTPAFRAADGRLWFGTGKGVSVVDPRRLPTDGAAPAAQIESVSVDGRRETGGVYPPGRGEVSVDYTALRFRAPGKLRFRHRLDGLDRDWVEAGGVRRAYYSSLPPGRYQFSVMASNWEGRWNGTPATFAFEIQPPFHRTPLFYAACGLLALALVGAAHRIRLNQMRSRFAAIIHERTRIARELHDTLAQGLAGVKYQIDTAAATIEEQPEIARESVHFARSMIASSLAEVRRSIWVLRAQAVKAKDGLGVSVAESLRQLTAESGLEMRIEVAGQARPLPAGLEHNVLRIAHEAVTNALRHAGARRLSIELQFDDDALRLRVRDDGRGFDPDLYLRGPRGQHFGLLGICERAQSLGGELHVRSRPGDGTEISCRLPYDCRTDLTDVESSEGASL